MNPAHVSHLYAAKAASRSLQLVPRLASCSPMSTLAASLSGTRLSLNSANHILDRADSAQDIAPRPSDGGIIFDSPDDFKRNPAETNKDTKTNRLRLPGDQDLLKAQIARALPQAIALANRALAGTARSAIEVLASRLATKVDTGRFSEVLHVKGTKSRPNDRILQNNIHVLRQIGRHNELTIPKITSGCPGKDLVESLRRLVELVRQAKFCQEIDPGKLVSPAERAMYQDVLAMVRKMEQKGLPQDPLHLMLWYHAQTGTSSFSKAGFRKALRRSQPSKPVISTACSKPQELAKIAELFDQATADIKAGLERAVVAYYSKWQHA